MLRVPSLTRERLAWAESRLLMGFSCPPVTSLTPLDQTGSVEVTGSIPVSSIG